MDENVHGVSQINTEKRDETSDKTKKTQQKSPMLKLFEFHRNKDSTFTEPHRIGNVANKMITCDYIKLSKIEHTHLVNDPVEPRRINRKVFVSISKKLDSIGARKNKEASEVNNKIQEIDIINLHSQREISNENDILESWYIVGRTVDSPVPILINRCTLSEIKAMQKIDKRLCLLKFENIPGVSTQHVLDYK